MLDTALEVFPPKEKKGESKGEKGFCPMHLRLEIDDFGN